MLDGVAWNLRFYDMRKHLVLESWTDVVSNPSSVVYSLCDPGQVTQPL